MAVEENHWIEHDDGPPPPSEHHQPLQGVSNFWDNLGINEVENEVVHEDQNDIYNSNVEDIFGNVVPPTEEDMENDAIAQQGYQSKTYVIFDTTILLGNLESVDRLIHNYGFFRNHLFFLTSTVIKELEILQQSGADNLSRLARETLTYLDLVTEVTEWWHGDRIIVQHNDDFESANRAFPNRQLASNQIIKSALLLQERGISTKMWTLNRGMKLQCRGSGIGLFNPDHCNVPNH